METYDRVYAKVDLDAIYQNILAIKDNIDSDTKICAVIKADGYGHGAVPVARTIDNLVWGYAVATIHEAVQLRNHGIEKPILILGYTNPNDYKTLIKYRIRPSIFSLEDAMKLQRVAKKNESHFGKAKIHIKLDTGMSRIGFQINSETVDNIKKISELDAIEIEGIFTHFATADGVDKTDTQHQLEKYNWIVYEIEKCGINIPIKHCSNSAAIIDIRKVNMDMVRAGIILYGLYPSDEVNKSALLLKPAMELKSRVVYLKTLEAGKAIGYGGTYVTKKKAEIATVPVGYGDGYPRALSNKGSVLIRGVRCKIVGRICMDQFMVDVTDLPDVGLQDEVTLIGRDGDEFISVEELAELVGSFNYEFVCNIGKRIPRVYIRNNKVVLTKDYFNDYYDAFEV